MLKATKLLDLAIKTFIDNNNKVIKIDGKTNETILNLFKNNKLRKLICILNIRAMGKLIFLTPNAKKALNYLWLAFIKALIV